MEVRRSARVTGLRRHPGGRGRGRLLRGFSSACEAEEADCDEFHVGRNVERRVPGPRGSDVRLLRCLMSRQSRPPLMSAPGEVHVHRKGARSAVRSATRLRTDSRVTTPVGSGAAARSIGLLRIACPPLHDVSPREDALHRMERFEVRPRWLHGHEPTFRAPWRDPPHSVEPCCGVFRRMQWKHRCGFLLFTETAARRPLECISSPRRQFRATESSKAPSSYLAASQLRQGGARSVAQRRTACWRAFSC